MNKALMNGAFIEFEVFFHYKKDFLVQQLIPILFGTYNSVFCMAVPNISPMTTTRKQTLLRLCKDDIGLILNS